MDQIHTVDKPEVPWDRGSISAVIPMFNERENVSPLVERLFEVFDRIGRQFEILLVDDGSSDGTGKAIIEEAGRHPEVRPILLARNYGQSTAMQAGFDAARGELIVTLDGDLQNDPADIPSLLEVLEEEGVDVVTGWRHQRQDDAVRMYFSRVANRLIARMTGIHINDNGCSLKAYRREVLERTRLYGELHRFLPALLSEVGADIAEVKVSHHPRRFGQSKYKLDRTIRVILDLMLIMFFRRYLQRPLHVFGGIGLVLAGAGGLMLTYLTSLKLFTHAHIGERPLLTLGVMLVMMGVMLVCQGLLGELIGRTFHATGGRAHYHVRSPEKIARMLAQRSEGEQAQAKVTC